MDKWTAAKLDNQLKQAERPIILDVRAEDKFAAGHIPSSMHIPKQKILPGDEQDLNGLTVLPMDQPIVVTCTTGNSAQRCATVLQEKGYQVSVLDGGITAWNAYKQK